MLIAGIEQIYLESEAAEVVVPHEHAERPHAFASAWRRQTIFISCVVNVLVARRTGGK